MKKITRRRLIVGSTLIVAAGAGVAYGLTPQPAAAAKTEETCQPDGADSPILVAYASPCGSTAEIALDVAQVLCDRGLATDVRPARSVKSLDGYRGVVLGSAIRMGQPARDATQFVERHAQVLATLPNAIFAVGMTLHVDTPQAREEMRRYAVPLAVATNPLSTGLFAGVFDPNTVEPIMRALTSAAPQAAMTPGDFRDWDAIRTWAADLANLL